MLICKCDKCGEEFDMEKCNVLITSRHGILLPQSKKYDICDKCWDDFNLWIKGHANFVPKTEFDEFGQPYCCIYDDDALTMTAPNYEVRTVKLERRTDGNSN